ncbi:MAG: MarR family transcriptional regulator [Pseudomonadales bacterium]|jgi:DNA-binding MarR family transcriptional regulator|nr:MarR family transcriptional regulator [Pseudomonadales bacterium]
MASKKAEERSVPTFDHSVHSELGGRLGELVDEVLRLHGRVMSVKRPSVLGGPGQTFVLASVVLAAEPPTVARIARSLGYTRQAIQRLADILAAQGYVSYEDNPHHKTSKQLVATALGRQVYAQVNQESAEWTERISQGLDVAALDQTLEVLRQVRHNLEQDKSASVQGGTEQQ